MNDFIALVNAENVEGVERLLKAGVDPDGRVFFCPLILYALLTNKGTAIVKLLIKYGADVNVQDHQGWTPLHRAALRNDPELATMLLKAGARLSARDLRGKAPKDVAREYGNEQMIAVLEAWRNKRRKRRRERK